MEMEVVEDHPGLTPAEKEEHLQLLAKTTLNLARKCEILDASKHRKLEKINTPQGASERPPAGARKEKSSREQTGTEAQRSETRRETGRESRPGTERETRPEVRRETRPETRPETRRGGPETRPETRRQERRETRRRETGASLQNPAPTTPRGATAGRVTFTPNRGKPQGLRSLMTIGQGKPR